MIKGTICCDIPGCAAQRTETIAGEGYAGWGAVHGIVLNGVANPNLCPAHLREVAELIDKMPKEK